MHDSHECRDHLHAIGSANARYVKVHGHYPPAYVTDEHGTPMHSWRVLILPYLDRPGKSKVARCSTWSFHCEMRPKPEA